MTEGQEYYKEYGGCSCHTLPPCSFCMSLTEEESDILWNGSISDLETHWKYKDSAEI